MNYRQVIKKLGILVILVGAFMATSLVWAALVGMSLQALGIHLPIWIDNTIGLIGGLAIPLMLLTLGVSLAKLRVASLGRSIALSAGRLAIGLAVGLAVDRSCQRHAVSFHLVLRHGLEQGLHLFRREAV